MSTTPTSASRFRPLFLILLAAGLALVTAACGDDDTDVATDPASDATTATSEETDPEAPEATDGDGDLPGSGATPEPVVEDDAGYEPVAPQEELTDPAPTAIDDIVVSDDDTTLGVRYTGAAQPCTGARVSVTESADDVSVVLETGLSPDAATMTCVAAILPYEVAVTLSEPLGDRTLVFETAPGEGEPGDGGTDDTAAPPADDPDGDDTSEDEMDDDGLATADSYVGLTIDEATAKADGEGRQWRIGREDGERFFLTEDFVETRLTFEVDDGIVTVVVTG